MKTIIYFLPFLLFVIYSCADNASDNESVDTFPANTSQENILKMSDFIESVQYIPLETNDSCLIGEISDIFPLQDEMVFVDRKYALSIYFYDYNGLFKRKISKRGVGPEEYIKISSVAISEKESHIYLYDAYLNKVLVYNFQGQYVDGHKIPFKFSSMAYLGNGLLACYADYFRHNNQLLTKRQTPLLVIYDLKNDKIQDCAFYENSSISMTETIGFDSHFSQLEHGCLFFYYLDNQIYRLNEEGNISTVLNINFGENNEKRTDTYKKYLMENEVPAVEVDRNKPDICTINNAVGNETFTLCYYNNFKTVGQGVCFYNHTDKRFYSGWAEHKVPLVNDIDGGCPVIARVVKGSNIYSVLQPIEIDMYKDKCEPLEELGVEEENNPVIMISEVKKY